MLTTMLRDRSGVRRNLKVERVECTEMQTVLAERGKGDRACDDKLMQGRHGGGKCLGERVYASCMCSGTHYISAGTSKL